MPDVQSVERAFLVLRTVATGPGGVSDVARRAGLPVSTTARLLATLEHLGAVVRAEPGPTFRIGPSIGDLASATDATTGFATRARVHLEALVAEVGETAGVSVPDGTREVRYLDQVECDNDVILRDWSGVSVPLHAVSSGLVLLAARTESEVREYCAHGLARFTGRTTTRTADLKRRLAQIRKDGYAWTVEEFIDGVSSVAAPIRDGTGQVVGALHVHGPSYRVKSSNRNVIRALVATAGRLSA
ncbi:MAG: IclR family transcriptional regulator [Acidimicrobiia bacterium]